MSELMYDREIQTENLIRSVQYILRLTPQQDIYENISKLIVSFFKASWVAFASSSRQEGQYEYYGLRLEDNACEDMDMKVLERVVSSVLDTGFIALETLGTSHPIQLVFLPLREQETTGTVMIIAHKTKEKLPKGLINSYLALSELSSTAIELRKHRSHLEEIIQERTKELKAANMRLKQINEKNENELMIANTFQTSLMSNVKKYTIADMYGKYIPCRMVGGDLYECTVSGESLWFIIADVAGHGVSSAMLSTMVKGIFSECLGNFAHPNEILENINKTLFKMLSDTEPYLISAFVGVIRDGGLTYSNAGHPYPVVIDCENRYAAAIEQNGFLLGLDSDTVYKNEYMDIASGQILLLYTDGLFSLRETGDANFWSKISEHSLKELDLLTTDPQAFIDRIIHSLRLENEKKFDDDACIMLICTK